MLSLFGILLTGCTGTNEQHGGTNQIPLNINACYGSTDSTIVILPTAEKDTALQNRLYEDLEWIRYPKISDTIAMHSDLTGCNIIAYGTPDGNLWLKEQITNLPVSIQPDKIEGRGIYSATDIRLIACWTNPANPDKTLVIYTAQTTEQVVGINSVFHGPCQYHIARGTDILEEGFYSFDDGRYGCSERPDVTLPELTHEQMAADYDTFVSIVNQVFPLFEINRQVYGMDLHEFLNKQRNRIVRSGSYFEFADILRTTVNKCRGSHFWLEAVDPSAYYEGFVEKESYRIMYGYELYIADSVNKLEWELPLLYYNGDYYVIYDFVYSGLMYEKGMKVMKYNEKTPDEIVNTLFDAGRPVYWDYKLNKNYLTSFYRYIDKDVTQVLFEFEDIKGIPLKVCFRTKEGPEYYAPEINRDAAVVYLDNDNILYIRLPEMQPSLLEYYRTELEKYGDKSFRAVVIDIRDNGGGSDLTWMKLLSLILPKDKPAVKTTRVAFKNSRINRKYLPRHNSGEFLLAGADALKIDYLNNEEFLVVDWTDTLVVDDNTLDCNGNIYVLSEDIYSSAGSLMNICKQFDNLVSVGFRNSDILGAGIDPFAFSLPHSKLIFKMEPVVDLTNARTAAEAHQTDVEVEVEADLPAMLNYYNFPDSISRTDFLQKHDPFYPKVLELCREGPIK
ncbi:MAG: S41 family peptidase [Bacteroidetes bacterium]|nr:S41 family peptidase [Bacteroidota bacterium]